MPGRRHARRIAFDPGALCFKPRGRHRRQLETQVLGRDELEALRLIELEGLYQEEAARRLSISRTTRSRILTRVGRTATRALLGGQRLVLDADSPTPAAESEPGNHSEPT
ncbi:MAG: DUF134 domain-containing protein [Gammaproteobacteria bacterium]|jgi:predicted DNA-binding protein (UPF0251 family)|nr:DUF134 domain-containing protein [Gammaproteobacteria bacterium]